MREHAAQAGALHLVGQFGVKRVHVDGQPPFAPQVIPGVLVTWLHEFIRQAQVGCQFGGEPVRVFAGVVAGFALVGKQRRFLPHRHTVRTPVNGQRPARQLLARIPLALAKVQKTALPVFGAQFKHQLGGKSAFGRPECIGVPFWCIAVAHGHKGRFTTHCQAHIALSQFFVHRLAQRHHVLPLRLGIRFGYARRFKNPRDRHEVLEGNLALVHAALNRCCPRGLWCAGQRYVALTGKQARSGIQPDPARTRQVHLAPGVQVGKVGFGATGAVQ